MADQRSASISVSRAALVAEARSWVGTPYRHQASCQGAGCDCLGLIRGIWRAFYGAELLPVAPYTTTWAEETGRETLYEGAKVHLVEVDKAAARAGDVILIRVRDRGPAKHAAIVSIARADGTAFTPVHIIHAYDRHAVMETALPAAWRRRIAFAFQFPGIGDADIREGQR